MPGNFAHKESTAQVRWMAANGQLRFGMKEAPLTPSPPRVPGFPARSADTSTEWNRPHLPLPSLPRPAN